MGDHTKSNAAAVATAKVPLMVLTCAVVRNELSECFEVVEMDDASGGSTQNELLSECFNKFMQRHEVFKWSSTSSFVVERNGDQLFEVVEIDEIDLFEQ